MQILQLVLHFDRHLGDAIAQYGTLVYFMLFAIVFCEMAFLPLFFLPGDPLLFICGAFCAMGGISPWLVMPVLFVAAVAGSMVNYGIGRRIGRSVFTRDYRWLDRAALRRTHAFYEDHGGVTFLLSPFIAVVRTFAPFVAGAAAMAPRKFVLSVVAGAALWVVTLVVGGYLFGNIPVVREHLSAIVLIGIAAGVGSLVLGGLFRLYHARKAR